MRKDRNNTFFEDFTLKFGKSYETLNIAEWVSKYYTNTNVHSLAIPNAVLLVHMYKEAKTRFDETKDINTANKIDIAELGYKHRLKDGVIKQISICKYFGLVEQPEDWRNSGIWRLTDLGRAVAKGLVTVPKYCTVVNGKVATKSKEEITLKEMFETYNHKVIRAIERKKKVNDSYYEFSKEYLKQI